MKTTTIGFEKPCSENWDNMSQNEKGSFCMSCKKTVIDFTSNTPEEIFKFISTAKSEVCGMVFPEQLNTPIVDLSSPSKWDLPHLNKAAGFLVAASLVGTQSVISQTEENNTSPPTEQQSSWTEAKTNSDVDPCLEVKSATPHVSFTGKVLSEFTQQGVENAEVIFVTKSKLYSTYTNSKGKFLLKLPEESIHEENVVMFHYDEIVRKTVGDTTERNLWRNKERYDNITNILSKDEITGSFILMVNQTLPMLGGLRLAGSFEKTPIVYIDGNLTKYKDYRKERYTKDGERKLSNSNESQYGFSGKHAEILHGKKVDFLLMLIYTENKN